MPVLKIYSAFDRPPTTLFVPLDGLARQSKCVEYLAEECDIKRMLDQARQGNLPDVADLQGVFADVSDDSSLEERLNQANEFRDAFSLLPAETRRVFDDDPDSLLDALQRARTDKDVRADLQDLGILEITKSAAQQPSDSPKTPENAEQAGRPQDAAATPQGAVGGAPVGEPGTAPAKPAA